MEDSLSWFSFIRENENSTISIIIFNGETFDTIALAESLIFIRSIFQIIINKKYRHLHTESSITIIGCKRWYRDGDVEYRFISWSASRRASSSISLSSCSSLFVSEKFPVMSFVGHFPYRTEKLNAKVLSDIQFHDAAGKRESTHTVMSKFGYPLIQS